MIKKLKFPEEALVKVEQGDDGKTYFFAVPRVVCDETVFFLTDEEDQVLPVSEEKVSIKDGEYVVSWRSDEKLPLWEPDTLSNLHRETVYAPSHTVSKPRRIKLKRASREDFSATAASVVEKSRKGDTETVTVSKTDLFPIRERCRGMFVGPHIGGQGDFAILFDDMIRSEDENTATYGFPSGAILRIYRFDKGLAAESGTFAASGLDGLHIKCGCEEA